jgi:2-iminoacetate synthase
MTFQSIFQQYSWESVRERIYDQTAQDVERALTKKRRTPEDFMALVSPAAALYLEHMAAESKRLTQQRFGKTIQLYVPMYLSNECQNICTYCGFSFTNKMPRTTLTDAQILQEVEAVKRHGYDHLLLVTGEANRTVGVDYLKNALRVVRPHFSNVTIEVQPLEENEYGTLREEGLYGVLV